MSVPLTSFVLRLGTAASFRDSSEPIDRYPIWRGCRSEAPQRHADLPIGERDSC